MPSQSYGQQNFMQDYIQRCEEAGSPLNDVQIEALGETIASLVQARNKQYKESATQLMDNDTLENVCKKSYYSPKKIIWIVQDYRAEKDESIPLREHPTDTQALELYQDAVALLDASNNIDPFTDNSNKVQELRTRISGENWNLTYPSFKILHAYLSARDLVTKEAPLPKKLRGK